MNDVSPDDIAESGIPKRDEYVGMNPTGTDFQPSCLIGIFERDENLGILTLSQRSIGPVFASRGATSEELNSAANPGSHDPKPFPE